MKALYVEWVDCVSITGNMWKSMKIVQDCEPSLCRSIGFIVAEDSEKIVMVNSIEPESDLVSGDLTIPKVAIKKKRIVDWK